jgi:hypothetical protein
VAWILLSKKSDVWITQSLGSDVSHPSPQPVLMRLSLNDTGVRIVMLWVQMPSQRVDHSLHRGWRCQIVPWVKLFEVHR